MVLFKSIFKFWKNKPCAGHIGISIGLYSLIHVPITSKVARASAKSLSIKTTVPEAVAAFLELAHRDGLEWVMKTDGDRRYAVVRKRS